MADFLAILAFLGAVVIGVIPVLLARWLVLRSLRADIRRLPGPGTGA